MPADPRSNPLALAVLVCLGERPMHLYEVASTLRERRKHESVRLNYGSLYAVASSLERRTLIAPAGTERAGNRPERTIYELTAAGAEELRDWLGSLLASPAPEFTGFEAALSFLPAIAPDAVLVLLDQRIAALESSLGEEPGARDPAATPRLFWIEEEYRQQLRRAQLEYVRALRGDIASGALDGIDWWRSIHA